MVFRAFFSVFSRDHADFNVFKTNFGWGLGVETLDDGHWFAEKKEYLMSNNQKPYIDELDNILMQLRDKNKMCLLAEAAIQWLNFQVESWCFIS